jgi:hypothetical protein
MTIVYPARAARTTNFDQENLTDEVLTILRDPVLLEIREIVDLESLDFHLHHEHQ